MIVNVTTILSLRDILGARQLALEVPDGTTVEGLLRELMARCGQSLIAALWDVQAARPVPHVRLLVNGQDIFFLDGLTTRLHEGDELLLLPPAAGG